MKYYTMCYPGEYGQHVQETLSEFQILKTYFPYWYGRMRGVNKLGEVTIENCIEDWIIGHLAWETDQFGNDIDGSF